MPSLTLDIVKNLRADYPSEAELTLNNLPELEDRRRAAPAPTQWQHLLGGMYARRLKF